VKIVSAEMVLIGNITEISSFMWTVSAHQVTELDISRTFIAPSACSGLQQGIGLPSCRSIIRFDAHTLTNPPLEVTSVQRLYRLGIFGFRGGTGPS
jgi:hypothetical protein